MVASDRVSVFDVVLPDLIPDKGRVLTALSSFWFEQTADIVAQPRDLVRSHRLPRDRGRRRGPGDARARGPADPARVRRARLPVRRRLERVPASRARSAGSRSPAGLRQAERLPEPLFTPTTKAETGHDLPLTAAEAVELVGADVYEQLRDLSLRLYELGAAHARRAAGSILADTKFEFGELDDEIIVIDEMMTPDSSRYWPLDAYQVGHVAAVVRQAVRARLHGRTGWNHEPPAPQHAGRGDREHARASTSRRTSSSPAQPSPTGTAPTSDDPGASATR